ncbi:Ubiquitin carboxyl-terminal hydrolase 23 [Diplonema papillatum]|nr:Ubiquitin carboxyl-terminal hydrolase 23 [Diplonema papillatum]
MDVSSRDLVLAGERGLDNPIGANNCFLNSVLQIMYHIQDFREQLIQTAYLNDTAVTALPLTDEVDNVAPEKKVLLDIAWLFKSYNEEGRTLLDPDSVRASMSKIMPRFRAGQLDDAHECFVAMLQILHGACGTSVGVDDGGPEILSGLAHDFFGLHMKSQAACKCGKTNRVIYSEAFYRTIWESTLRNDEGEMAFQKLIGPQDAPITCDNEECKAKINMQLYIRKLPTMLTVNVSWAREQCTREDLRKLLAAIPVRWRLQDAFEYKNQGDTPIVAVLEGVVFYYGLHYISTFFSRSKGVWVIFDDSSVRAAAQTVPGLWQYAVDGKLMPFMLFYRTAAGTDPAMEPVLKSFGLQVTVGEPSMLEHDRKTLHAWLKKNTRKDPGEDEDPNLSDAASPSPPSKRRRRPFGASAGLGTASSPYSVPDSPSSFEDLVFDSAASVSHFGRPMPPPAPARPNVRPANAAFRADPLRFAPKPGPKPGPKPCPRPGTTVPLHPGVRSNEPLDARSHGSLVKIRNLQRNHFYADYTEDDFADAVKAIETVTRHSWKDDVSETYGVG